MKKYIAWILILTTLMMAGCHFTPPVNTDPSSPVPGNSTPSDPEPTAPSRPTEPSVPSEPSQPAEPSVPTEPVQTDPSEPTPVDPTIPDGFPADLNTDADTVAMFQSLFEAQDTITFWNVALCQHYDDALSMDLQALFYNGCPIGAPSTEHEYQELGKMIGKEIESDINRCVPTEMDQVLTELFGLTLEDFPEDALKDFLYLESTGCYYLLRYDAMYAHKLSVIGFRELQNGNIEVYYTCGSAGEKGVITLKPNGSGYHILSNTVPAEPSQPTDPEPSVPTVPVGPDGFPIDLNTNADVVKKFQKLFDNDSWHTQALFMEFDDPRSIWLNDFLFGDLMNWPYEKLTAEESEKLRQQLGITAEWWVDVYSIEASTVEEVLQTVFGYSFADFKDCNDPYIRYLESTDSYYYGRSDSSLVRNVSVAGIRELENGNIEVYYTCEWLYPEEGVVTLKPVGDSYHVFSNKGL